MGLLNEKPSNFLLRLQWVAGFLNLTVLALLNQYLLFNVKLNLFILVGLSFGFICSWLVTSFKDKLNLDFQLLIVALNALLAFAFAFHPFSSRWIGPINIFAGSFLYAVSYKFHLLERLSCFLRKLASHASNQLPRPTSVARYAVNYRKINLLKIKRKNRTAARKMRRARSLTYLLIFMQIFTILSIPGCALMASRYDFLGLGIERIYVDKSRYPSVVGDRVFSLEDSIPDSRLPPNPLFCNYYQYFNGRANISCVYLQGKIASVASIDQDGCKLLHGRSNSPDCKPEVSTISIDDVPSEKLLSKQVRDEEIARKLRTFAFLVLLVFSFGSPMLLPIFRWLQWRSCKD